VVARFDPLSGRVVLDVNRHSAFLGLGCPLGSRPETKGSNAHQFGERTFCTFGGKRQR
jgi:hypothetical protein